MLISRSPLWILLASLVLSACGKSGGAYPDHEPGAQYTGDITPLVEKFRSGPGFGPCEEGRLERMLEIGRELDARKAALAEYVRSNGATQDDPRYRTIQMGPLSVLEPVAKFTPSPDAWPAPLKYGWNTSFNMYAQMKEKAQPTMADWYELNKEVRETLVDDENRIIYGDRYDVSHDDFPAIESIWRAYSKCEKTSGCDQPDFSEIDRLWMMSRKSYGARLSELASSDATVRRAAMGKLEGYIGADWNRFSMRTNKTAVRNGNELRVSLAAGDLKGGETALAEAIESVWSTDTLHVKIDWRDPMPSVFRFLLANATSGRSFVMFAEQTVTLFSGVRKRSIAHEFGHVLGIRDHYYTRWDEARCLYLQETNPGDLMSNSRTGNPTASEWQILDQTYPAKAAL